MLLAKHQTTLAGVEIITDLRQLQAALIQLVQQRRFIFKAGKRENAEAREVFLAQQQRLTVNRTIKP
jgi:hypothetical protein